MKLTTSRACLTLALTIGLCLGSHAWASGEQPGGHQAEIKIGAYEKQSKPGLGTRILNRIMGKNPLYKQDPSSLRGLKKGMRWILYGKKAPTEFTGNKQALLTAVKRTGAGALMAAGLFSPVAVGAAKLGIGVGVGAWTIAQPVLGLSLGKLTVGTAALGVGGVMLAQKGIKHIRARRNQGIRFEVNETTGALKVHISPGIGSEVAAATIADQLGIPVSADAIRMATGGPGVLTQLGRTLRFPDGTVDPAAAGLGEVEMQVPGAPPTQVRTPTQVTTPVAAPEPTVTRAPNAARDMKLGKNAERIYEVMQQRAANPPRASWNGGTGIKALVDGVRGMGHRMGTRSANKALAKLAGAGLVRLEGNYWRMAGGAGTATTPQAGAPQAIRLEFTGRETWKQAMGAWNAQAAKAGLQEFKDKATFQKFARDNGMTGSPIHGTQTLTHTPPTMSGMADSL